MASQTPKRPRACAGCRLPQPIAFTIARHDKAGAIVEQWQLCSIVCVLRWAYAWTSAQTKNVSSAIESTITNLITTFGAGRRE